MFNRRASLRDNRVVNLRDNPVLSLHGDRLDDLRISRHYNQPLNRLVFLVVVQPVSHRVIQVFNRRASLCGSRVVNRHAVRQRSRLLNLLRIREVFQRLRQALNRLVYHCYSPVADHHGSRREVRQVNRRCNRPLNRLVFLVVVQPVSHRVIQVFSLRVNLHRNRATLHLDDQARNRHVIPRAVHRRDRLHRPRLNSLRRQKK